MQGGKRVLSIEVASSVRAKGKWWVTAIEIDRVYVQGAAVNFVKDR